MGSVLSSVKYTQDGIPYYYINDIKELNAIDVGGNATVMKGYGRVVKGKKKKRRDVAVKMFSKLNEDSNREIQLLKNLSHSNIVELFGVIMNQDGPQYTGYVMEYMKLGSLHNKIHCPTKTYDFNLVIKWIRQIAEGLEYLHQQGIIHRDLKPKNILLAAIDHIKLADFGLARILSTQDTNTFGMIGTEAYRAPEVLASSDYGPQADVYSFGIIIWEIFHRRLPQEYIRISEAGKENYHVELLVDPGLLSAESVELLQRFERCWNVNADERPEIQEIIGIVEENTLPENGVLEIAGVAELPVLVPSAPPALEAGGTAYDRPTNNENHSLLGESSEKQQTWLSDKILAVILIISFFLGLAFLIAGSIMLGIGTSKTLENYPIPTVTPIYATIETRKIAYIDVWADYESAMDTVIDQIRSALHPSSSSNKIAITTSEPYIGILGLSHSPKGTVLVMVILLYSSDDAPSLSILEENLNNGRNLTLYQADHTAISSADQQMCSIVSPYNKRASKETPRPRESIMPATPNERNKRRRVTLRRGLRPSTSWTADKSRRKLYRRNTLMSGSYGYCAAISSMGKTTMLSRMREGTGSTISIGLTATTIPEATGTTSYITSSMPAKNVSSTGILPTKPIKTVCTVNSSWSDQLDDIVMWLNDSTSIGMTQSYNKATSWLEREIIAEAGTHWTSRSSTVYWDSVSVQDVQKEYNMLRNLTPYVMTSYPEVKATSGAQDGQQLFPDCT